MALHHITLNKKKEIMIKKNERRAQDVKLSSISSANTSCHITEDLVQGTLHVGEDLDLSFPPRCAPAEYECYFCGRLPECCDFFAPISQVYLKGSLKNIHYRSKVTDSDHHFDFVFNFINLGTHCWEIDIVRFPDYRGKNTSAEIIHTLPSERGGWKIRVEDGMYTEEEAKRYAMCWADLQAEYIKTGITPDEQIWNSNFIKCQKD